MTQSDIRTDGRENWLLASLPDAAYQRVLSLCETLPLPMKTVVIEENVPIEYAHFPMTGCLSMLALMKDGALVEVGTIGWEGMASVAFIHGTESVPQRCLVQVPGVMRRIPRELLMAELRNHHELRDVLQRYADVWINQISQAVACNGTHTIEKRLARWLLLTHDRVVGDLLPLTQELLAIMLAVRRSSVTIAATTLQNERLIGYSHGKITVVDRAGLEAASCECYEVMRGMYATLLPDPPERDASRQSVLSS
ncbi:MAG: transcriptional regulator, Crp/Fnr family [Gemmatimonadetes bacterium]|nr:transcriptional regulator, Crp/Fnr family [Gemmatimonadota bacterium]